MQNKFNFYDFVGYIIPGLLACTFLYWLVIGFFSLPLVVEVKSVGESILYLGLAYFFGHIVQVYGNSVEKKAVKKWGGWFSEQFMRDNNTYFTPSFRSELRSSMKTVFGEPTNVGGDDQKQADRRQELFNLCYSLIVQEKAASHTEIFNGIYSLCRGMLAATDLGVITSVVIIAKYAIILLLPCFKFTFQPTPFWSFSDLHLGLGIGALISFLMIRRPLQARLKEFGERFADSVYRSFYVWSKRKPH
ncbi:MAG: hypothetical protein HY277_08365 [Ignavibacteriales bacterium]|nr:hypothetical protein [Ignavibacteriales bacterium]